MKCHKKIPWISMLSANMSTSSKGRSHYSILDIDTKATLDQVKTAYFKMSMQYHPDKNSSAEAKVKFREISEAYEVLGNYDKRKNYDRGLKIRTSYDEPREGIVRTKMDYKKEAYRVRTALYRHSNPSPNEKLYDFDAWTKAHYGRVFRRSQKEKDNMKWQKELHQEASDSGNLKKELSIMTIFFFVCLILLNAQTSGEKFAIDQPQITNHDEQGKLMNVVQTNSRVP